MATTPHREVLGRSDSACLCRILSVLIGNGLRFTECGGVYVHLGATETDVEIRVRDTGDGINLAILPGLFEGLGGQQPFNDGAGVGLALVQRLVYALGGTIDEESAPREGPECIVRLPRAMSALPVPPGDAVPDAIEVAYWWAAATALHGRRGRSDPTRKGAVRLAAGRYIAGVQHPVLAAPPHAPPARSLHRRP